jgi:hypothetical protein
MATDLLAFFSKLNVNYGWDMWTKEQVVTTLTSKSVSQHVIPYIYRTFVRGRGKTCLRSPRTKEMPLRFMKEQKLRPQHWKISWPGNAINRNNTTRGEPRTNQSSFPTNSCVRKKTCRTQDCHNLSSFIHAYIPGGNAPCPLIMDAIDPQRY